MRIGILIPIYKEVLSVYEKISLMQVNRVLGKYEKIFIAPQNLDFDYGIEYRSYLRICFHDTYFTNKKSYSELLLSPLFYEKLSAYDYILIYQLDAFVFSDKLEYFCGLNYDYIGAPCDIGNWKNYHVGNGGLSLRRVKNCLELVRRKEEIIEEMSRTILHEWGEDDFFSFCGKNASIKFCVPSARIASVFSVQYDYSSGYRNIERYGLPFGCHYWTTLNYDYWHTIIECYGYRVPYKRTGSLDSSLECDKVRRMIYLAKRCLRKHNTLNLNRVISIWGAGSDGIIAIKFFAEFPLNFCVTNIYDMFADNTEMYHIPIVHPTKNVLLRKRTFIIVSTRKYEEDIFEKLHMLGLVEWKDYVSFFSFVRAIYHYAVYTNNVSYIFRKAWVLMLRNDDHFYLFLRKDKKQIDDFMSRFPNIYIYGNGQVARKFWQYLYVRGYNPRGIIVSNGHKKDAVFTNVPIYELDEVNINFETDGIIIALRTMYQKEVIDNLRILGCENNIYVIEDALSLGYEPHEKTRKLKNDHCFFDSYFKQYSDLNSLGDKYKTDKAENGHDYLRKYEFFLQHLRHEKFNLIELGVYKGSSVKLWEDYFRQAEIYGIDIDDVCMKYESERVRILIGDCSQISFLKKLRTIKPRVIVDDASHNWSDQITALFILFPSLSPAGIYIIEDLETSFSAFFNTKYADASLTTFEILKYIAEAVTSGCELEIKDKSDIPWKLGREINFIAKDITMICFIEGSCIIIKK